MSNVKPESLIWLDNLASLTIQLEKDPSATHAKLADFLDLNRPYVSSLIAIQSILDPAAVEKIRLAASPQQIGTAKASPYILSFNSALALARLKGRAADLSPTGGLSGTVHAALDITLSRRLATGQIKALVEWIVSGKPAAEFDPKHKAVKTPPSADKSLEQPNFVASPTPSLRGTNQMEAPSQQVNASLDFKKLAELLKKAEAEKALGKETAAQEKLDKYLRNLYSPSSPSKTPPHAPGSEKGLSETIFLDWLADIPLIARIKSKVKKGRPLTGGEAAWLWLHKAGEIAGRLLKAVLKLFKPFFKILHWVWKILADTLKEVGLYKYAKAFLVFAAFFTACWFAWEAFHYGFMRPVGMIWSRIHHEHAVEESNANTVSVQPSPAPQMAASAQAPKKTARPAPVYQPAVSFKTTASPINPSGTLYDPKLLETEIAAIPPGSLVKDFPLQPDESMPGDLAVSRLRDLTDTDKYTMKIGHGTEKILSVIPSGTNLAVSYKSADALGGFLDGSGQMNFFWEDVKVIHVNELDVETKTPSVIYQCSLIVSGAKNPLTIQCASADDLEHLVSTMEYFIRSSRLARDTALAGMPYPSQGMRLNGDSLVTLLWAGSPAGRAGVKCGEYVWSVGGDSYQKQREADLEAALRSLAPGTTGLYVVSADAFDKAFAANNADRSKPVNPARQKMKLVIP